LDCAFGYGLGCGFGGSFGGSYQADCDGSYQAGCDGSYQAGCGLDVDVGVLGVYICEGSNSPCVFLSIYTIYSFYSSQYLKIKKKDRTL
jgi:hypothetical protein